MKVTERGKVKGLDKSEFRIEMGRYQDHLRLRLESRFGSVEAIIALTDKVSWAYMGITGENCHIYDIKTEKTAVTMGENDIDRIANEISYIDRFESDIPNIQINGTRTDSTPGIPVKDGLKLMFHTMSLPMAFLVWHCPYIVVFYSEDGLINGPGYTEYAMIKLNGEDNGSKDYVTNVFTMKKTAAFKDWNVWKEKNKIGFEVEVDFTRKGKKIVLSTENLGIRIHNAMTVLDDHDDIYVALTGDQVALTDIRVR
nr:diguanylate cyclase [Lachnospiraceae bacterium]